MDVVDMWTCLSLVLARDEAWTVTPCRTAGDKTDILPPPCRYQWYSYLPANHPLALEAKLWVRAQEACNALHAALAALK